MKRKRGADVGRAPFRGNDTTKRSRISARWAHCEWFFSFIDAPLFAHSDFCDVLRSMGLSPPSGRATRAEWGRLRAAMCNAFENYAAPRRLSNAYLAMERRDLALYRADARAYLRGRPLPEASEPSSGLPLRPEWWARYRHPPPDPLPPGTALLVRNHTDEVLPAVFLDLIGEMNVRVQLNGATQPMEVKDTDVMLAPVEAPNSSQPHPLLLPFTSTALPETSGQQDPLLALSPRPKDAAEDDVEAEVDVSRVASLIRLVEMREEAVAELKRANNAVEESLGETRDSIGEHHFDPKLVSSVQQAATNVIDLAARASHLLPSSRSPASASPSAPTTRIVDGGVIQKLEDVFDDSALTTSAPPMAPTTLAHPIVTLLETPHDNWDVASAPALDLETTEGVTTLGKALVRRAAKVSKYLGKRGCDGEQHLRAEVVECIVACVTVLIRARATRSRIDFDELLSRLCARFPAAEPIFTDVSVPFDHEHEGAG